MTYAQLVDSLAKPGNEIRAGLSAHQAHLLHMALLLCTEAGELATPIKAFTIYGKALDIANIKEELGDLEFAMEGIRQACDLTREECLQHNIQKLTARYGNIYSDKAAIKRADKNV